MAIITKSELRKYRWKSINESIGLRSSPFSGSPFSDYSREKKIFLSHKHTDKEYVFYLKKLLAELEINLYVDWLDGSMPEHTNAETAREIKDKIEEMDKFILLATDDAIHSRWCNWELGLAHNTKFDKDKLALFPVRQDGSNWSGSEYMQLYPVIEYQNGSNRNTRNQYIKKGYYVFYPEDNQGNRRYKNLTEWLQK